VTAGSDPSGEPKTAPLHVAPPSDQHHHQPDGTLADQSVVPPAIGSTAGEACPTCGAAMALDQRYCLSCGSRRGDPRLPLMDAVVFMEASRQPKVEAAAAAAAPPPPPAQKSGLSPGATLIAGIATLILAVGVGVLIGRSGDDSATQLASPKPTVIQFGGSSGGGEVEIASEGNAAKKASKGTSKSNDKGGGKKANEAPPEKEVDSSGTSKAAAEVLKPAGDVKLPPPTTEVGEKCEKGTEGCSDSGEFNGNFFGE
jgi:hypothetical protein